MNATKAPNPRTKALLELWHFLLKAATQATPNS